MSNNLSFLGYLGQEREYSQSVVSRFSQEQKKRWSGISPQLSWLMDQVDDYLLRGGKWHRPALARLAFEYESGKWTEALKETSVVIELYHRYILVHDDIADRDKTRHGGPTFEQVFLDEFSQRDSIKQTEMPAIANAMIAGDLVNILVQEFLRTRKIDAGVRQNVWRGLSQMMIQTIAGWYLETELKHRSIAQVSEAEVIQAMNLVSVEYSVLWPLRIGQILAGRQEWDQSLEEYGKKVGLAFQLQDDVLGMMGDETVTGKPVGNDLAEGKKSLLMLDAFEQASEEDRNFLNDRLGKQCSKAEVARTQTIITTTGALDRARERSRTMAREGAAVLDKKPRGVSQKAAVRLGELAAYLANREL